MGSLSFYGSGYSVTSAIRHNTSLFLQKDGTNLLIDCNGICGQQLARQHIDLNSIKHIYLTHEHIDHIGALANLIHQMWVKTCLYCEKGNERTDRLNIYANKDTIKCVKAMFDSVYLFDQPGMFPILFHELKGDGGVIQIGDFNINYFPVAHNDTPCLGLATQIDSKQFVYSADSSPIDSIYSRLKDGDILVHDCNRIDEPLSGGHTTWDQLRDMLPSLPDITLYLVHLPDTPSAQEKAFKAYLKANFGEKVFMGEDGLKVQIK